MLRWSLLLCLLCPALAGCPADRAQFATDDDDFVTDDDDSTVDDDDSSPPPDDDDSSVVTDDDDSSVVTDDDDSSVDPWDNDGVVTFAAIGDTPYTQSAKKDLQGHIVQLNELDPSLWMIHLGDIKGGSAPCVEEVYDEVADTLLQAEGPVYIIPGDNEWNDCDDPDPAWGFWEGTFARFHEAWTDHPPTIHQASRDENFSFVDDGVLFVGINLVGGTVHDADEWAARMADDLAWWEAQVGAHGDLVGAAVLLGHALVTSNHSAFFDGFRTSAAAWGKPVLYLHGDGHSWAHDQPWSDAPNVTRVMVDAPAPPVLVTVDPSAGDVFTFERDPFGAGM